MATVSAQLSAIKKQRDMLEKKEQALIAKSHEKLLTKIVQMAKDAGLTASDINSALNSGKPSKARNLKAAKSGKKSTLAGAKVAAKYRNPTNYSETWTGRGISPKWIAELKSAGTLESALIKIDKPVITATPTLEN